MVFAHERRRYGTKTVSRRKWRKITIINAKWKTWKTTQKLRSFYIHAPWLFSLYCVAEKMKMWIFGVRFVICFFFCFCLINTHTVLALRIQLSNSCVRISYYTHSFRFVFVIFHFLLIATFFFDMFDIGVVITVLLFFAFVCDIVDGGDAMIFFFFILYFFYVRWFIQLRFLFTVSIYCIYDSMQREWNYYFHIFFIWLLFKQQNWISKTIWINENWWEKIFLFKRWKTKGNKTNKFTHSHTFTKNHFGMTRRKKNIFSWIARRKKTIKN